MSTQTAASSAAIVPQHLEALAKANRVRFAQVDLRRRIGAGTLHLDALLCRTADLTPTDEDALDRLTVRGLLVMAHRVGSKRATRILRDVGIPEMKPVGRMTDRQRHALAAALRDAKAGCGS